MTGIGASRPLRRIPAIVSFLNPQPALSLVGGNGSSYRFAVTRCDQRRRPMKHLCDIRSTPTSGASEAPTRCLSRVLCAEDERRNDRMEVGGWLRGLRL